MLVVLDGEKFSPVPQFLATDRVEIMILQSPFFFPRYTARLGTSQYTLREHHFLSGWCAHFRWRSIGWTFQVVKVWPRYVG